MCQNVLSTRYAVANWHPPSNPEMLEYRQVDPWDSLAVQPSLLRELQAKERLCLENWSWVTPCRRYWRLSSTLHMWHMCTCMPTPTHDNTYVHACPYPHMTTHMCIHAHTHTHAHRKYEAQCVDICLCMCICVCVCTCIYVCVCTCTGLKLILLNSPSKGLRKSCGQGKRQKWNGLVIILVSSGFQSKT